VLTGGMLIFAVGLSIGKAGLYVLPFAGAMVAFFWPTFIITCMRYWKEDAAIPISCILPMQSLIGIPIQFILGVLNDHFGPTCAYWSTVVVIALATILLICYHKIVLNKEKKLSEESALLSNTNTDETQTV